MGREAVLFLGAIIRASKQKSKGRRWNFQEKALFLFFYKRSPALYIYLRSCFPLSSRHTLKSLFRELPFKPGINSHVFQSLKRSVQKMKECDRLCAVLFDEMAIRQHLQYNRKLDRIEGFQDHGSKGRTCDVANHALVFMVRGLRRKWKQPVTYYFSRGSTKANELEHFLKEVLDACHDAGLTVAATVCDLGISNRTALNALKRQGTAEFSRGAMGNCSKQKTVSITHGVTNDKQQLPVTFKHGGRDIATVYDPPHILKCTRNMFMKHDVALNVELAGQQMIGFAKWEHIVQLYQIDKLQPDYMQKVPKLTEKHINPSNQQRMKVKLAAQVLSHSVASTICCLISQGAVDQFSYRPSLLNAPDLPPWIHYIFSNRHQTGFLYGVPPKEHGDLELEIVGLNRKNYETRRRVVHMNVQEKPDPAKHEVQLKIDNLNVEDMFDSYRLNRLLDVFRRKLWRESADDLYVTFLASAVHLGARLPLRPNEGEGVVMRIGSRAQFSTALIELQDEVKPLWKMVSCPRDFKRTTVERLFRDEGFALDWCAFRLVEAGSSSLHQHFPAGADMELPIDHHPLSLGQEDRWIRPSKSEIPQRSYVREFVYTIMVPVVVMVILVLILSLILCFHHEGISKRNKETPAVQMVQYTAVHRATNTLRSLSSQRQVISDQCSSTVSRSRTASPNSSLPRTSTPRLSMECNTYYRPNPPPYTGPNHSRADF